MTDAPDVVDVLTADHRAIRALLDELDATEDPVELQRVYVQLASQLAAHEAAEQAVVFPALGRSSGGDARLGEHEEINDLLAEMRSLAPSSFGFAKRAGALALDIRAHFEAEEEQVFPRLRAVFEPGRLAELARDAQLAKEGAPAFPPAGPHVGVA